MKKGLSHMHLILGTYICSPPTPLVFSCYDLCSLLYFEKADNTWIA